MTGIEATPAAVGAIYETMARKLETARRRAGRPFTLTDKILLGHLDDPAGQDIEPGSSELLLRPDRVVLPDVLGQTALLQFIQTGMPRVAVPTTIHCDHLIQARLEGQADLRSSLEENREIYGFLRSAAARYGAGFWSPGAGIVHQVVLENYAFPGAMIVGTDSHTPNAGGLGACAVGVGGAEAAEVLAGLPWEVRYPRRIAVVLIGELKGWASAKDVILWLAGRLGVSGGTHAILEYIGPGARTISATGKATIANMGAELGATTSLFPADARMARFLSATGRGDLVPLIERYRELLAPDRTAEASPEKHYDAVIELDLATLEPHVTGPHTPDLTRPVSALAAQLKDGRISAPEPISTALIGSCTNSSYEDMSRAAGIAEQARARGLRAAVPLLVTPGSEQIRATIERDGQMRSLQAVGGVVLANACGPCIGQWRRGAEAAKPNTIVSSYNRNFPGRNDGQATTQNFLASPELVMAFALAGRLTFNPLTDSLTGADGRPFRLEPPPAAPEVPENRFASRGDCYTAPPSDGRGVALAIDPGSERLQLLQPWPAWDGRDFIDLPVLMKARGKTTTDQITPAGPWMRFRGHIGRSSDNLLLGAVNAFTGETGRVGNAITGGTAQNVAHTARHYQSLGLRWVVVGDHNYGEGSSREHAALSPRYLGCVAVIARSFARIHEANLKKQGLLALTFGDAADYDRIREHDRISLVGLGAMAPGVPIECRIAHADGTGETLWFRHTCSGEHIAWFRAGSALNAASSRRVRPESGRGD
jgi:aconitate hydratase